MGLQSKFVVLVVEDDLITRMDAIEMVSEAGFEAIAAENADEAVALLEGRDDIRVIVTDVNMPGSMDGLKLAHAVRRRWPPIEIIVVSALALELSELPERGVFFRKPYKSEQITQALREFTA